MAGILAPVEPENIEFVGNDGINTGTLQVDIEWDGQANSVDAHQLRTRWISRSNGASSPAPTMAAAGAWAESTVLGTAPGTDFRYIDTIEILTAAQMDVAGINIREENEQITVAEFANRTVWAMSRLEVA